MSWNKAVAALVQILDKPFPPMAMADLEELMYWKRWLERQPDGRTSRAYKAIQNFEDSTKFPVPGSAEMLAAVKPAVEALDKKLYWTMQDTMILSYWKRMGEVEGGTGTLKEDQETLLEFLKRRGIDTVEPNPDFFEGKEEMVKGVRVDISGAAAALEAAKAAALEELYTNARSYKRGPLLRARSSREMPMAEATTANTGAANTAEATEEGEANAGAAEAEDIPTKFVGVAATPYKAALTDEEYSKVSVGPSSGTGDPLPQKEPRGRIRADSETDTSFSSEIYRLPGDRGASAAIAGARHIPPSYEDIESFRNFSIKIDKSFWDLDSTNSTALDIIAVYLKGQKVLYIEAKTYCEQHLTVLMIPAILISAACTVLSVSLGEVSWGNTFVSALTAVNSFILSIVSYLKLDAKAEAHKSSSYQFDKLQTMCEFHSGKTLFFSDQTAAKVVGEIQKKVEEIKDTNQFIIPESVRYRFPVLYNTNVFAEVKKIENMENIIKNKLNFVFMNLEKLARTEDKTPQILDRIKELEKDKMTMLREYMQLRELYLKMDEKFNNEINGQIKASQRICCNPLNWFKT